MRPSDYHMMGEVQVEFLGARILYEYGSDQGPIIGLEIRERGYCSSQCSYCCERVAEFRAEFPNNVNEQGHLEFLYSGTIPIGMDALMSLLGAKIGRGITCPDRERWRREIAQKEAELESLRSALGSEAPAPPDARLE